MTTSHLGEWSGIWLDAMSLSLEASTVIGLRLCKIARGGPAGSDEARLMVSEKVGAALEMQSRLGLDLTSSLLGRSQMMLGHYGKVVRANRERLSH